MNKKKGEKRRKIKKVQYFWLGFTAVQGYCTYNDQKK